MNHTNDATLANYFFVICKSRTIGNTYSHKIYVTRCYEYKALSIMLYALWDQRHENATGISQEILMISIDQMRFEIAFLTLLTHLSASSELMSMSMLQRYTPND